VLFYVGVAVLLIAVALAGDAFSTMLRDMSDDATKSGRDVEKK
jgi:hypothetical protein